MDKTTAQIGLERGRVTVVAYKEAWAKIFEIQRNEILSALAASEVSEVNIEHIGSTAVVGLASKPIIDIAMDYDSAEEFGRVSRALKQCGFEHRGEQGVLGRELFVKRIEEIQTHFVHVVKREEQSNSQWHKLIIFRDVLRSDPELAATYGALKTTLAKQFASDRQSYTSHKNEFISACLARLAD